MNEWMPGYKVVLQCADDAFCSAVYNENPHRVAYRPGEVARPPSWLHGPLFVFSDRWCAENFAIWDPTLRVLPVAYQPSAYLIGWIPVGYSGVRVWADWISLGASPVGTRLADEVYVFEPEQRPCE